MIRETHHYLDVTVLDVVIMRITPAVQFTDFLKTLPEQINIKQPKVADIEYIIDACKERKQHTFRLKDKPVNADIVIINDWIDIISDMYFLLNNYHAELEASEVYFEML